MTNAKAANYGLKIGLIWWVLGMILAAGYLTFLYCSFSGKATVDKDSHGYDGYRIVYFSPGNAPTSWRPIHRHGASL